MPPGGLNIRLGDTVARPGSAPARLQARRHARLRRAPTSSTASSCRAGASRRIGIITVGKSYLDVRQALDELGLDEVRAATTSGCGSTRSACPWPIGRDDLLEFARRARPHHRRRGEALADRGAGARGALRHAPTSRSCIGKKDEQGNWLFPVKGALDANDIAIAHRRAAARSTPRSTSSQPRVARLKDAQRVLAETQDVAVRTPYFCSGCPHNSSTVVPEGSRAYAGIGCHYMVAVDGPLDRAASPRWAARARTGSARRRSPSGRMSSRTSATAPTTTPARWRSAPRIAAGVNITYKILFNDAVAMTGGQKNDGGLTVPQIAAAGRGRRRQARRRRHRRAGEISAPDADWPERRHDPPSRRPRRGAAGARRRCRASRC